MQSPKQRKQSMRLLGIVCAVALSAGSVLAQQTGTVKGRVVDQTKGVVPGVTLVLVNVDTNVDYRQTSGDEGGYVFNYIPPGNYTLTGEVLGLKGRVGSIRVTVGEPVVITLELRVAEKDTAIEVTAETANVDVSSSVVGTNIDKAYVRELPSSSRNVLDLIDIDPGVNSTPRKNDVVTGADGDNMKISGGRQAANAYFIDGSDSTMPWRNTMANMPSFDALEEVQVTTSNGSAEFGKQGGGVLQVVTKSGTNDWHGSGYYFGRAKGLNANTWARNKSRTERADDVRKRMGATLGGPIFKDKTFFFLSFDRYRNDGEVFNNNIRGPSTKILAGDFSEFAGTIYNPETKQPVPNNNLAAAGLLDPVAVAIAKLWKKNGEFPVEVDKLGDKFIRQEPTSTTVNQYLVKLDHRLTETQNVSGTYFWVDSANTSANNGVNHVPGWGSAFFNVAQKNISARHTWFMKNSLVLENRFSMMIFDFAPEKAPETLRNLADFGATWPDTSTDPRYYHSLPSIQIPSFGAGFRARTEFTSPSYQRNFNFGSTLNWIKGSHNLKFGFQSVNDRMNSIGSEDNVDFRFTGLASNKGSNKWESIANAEFAHAWADFMMGRIDNFIADGLNTQDLSDWAHFLFVQDNWQVHPRVTLSPGLRYEYYTPGGEDNNYGLAYIGPGYHSPKHRAAPEGLAFLDDPIATPGRQSGYFYKPDNNNFGPRLGVAWDVRGNGKTAIRGAVGLYFQYIHMQIKTGNGGKVRISPMGGRLNDPWLTTTSPVYTTRPVPIGMIFDQNYVWPPLPLTGRYINYSDDLQIPENYEFNLTVEERLARGWTVQGAYVGNRRRKLMHNFNLNIPQYVTYSGAQPSTANINKRRPNQNFFSDILSIASFDTGRFDALQLQTSFRSGLVTARVSYALQKGIVSGIEEDAQAADEQVISNPYDPNWDRGETLPRHILRGQFVLELPFFRNSKRSLRSTLGGWSVSGSFNARSGNPMNVTQREIVFDDAGGDRPDLVGPIRYPKEILSNGTMRYVSIDAFKEHVPAPATAVPVAPKDSSALYGNLPFNAVRGMGSWSADGALSKSFRVKEDIKAQVRLEAYNIFNHPVWGGPATLSINDPTRFGVIETKGGNRTMQFGLRVNF